MKRLLQQAAVCCVAVFLLTWMYFSNPLAADKESFLNFQQDSNALVYSTVLAKEHNISTDNYGLGFYCSTRGELYPSYGKFQAAEPVHLPESHIEQGYLTTAAGIAVRPAPYSVLYLVPGNVVELPNGQKLTITAAEDHAEFWLAKLDSAQPLTADTAGSVLDIRIYSPDGTRLPAGYFGIYASQYGLQGRVLAALHQILPGAPDVVLPLVCAFAFALTVTVVAVLLWKKYNLLAAACFVGVFALSSWTISYARSVYWVECTWLLPAVVGLTMSLHSEKRLWRWGGYGAMLLATMVKSLCGYEYITFVMLCGVLPLMGDVLQALLEKDREKCRQTMVTLITTGIFSLLGFVLALLLHANIRGGGDLLNGLQQIYENDVLRRAIGGNAADFTGSVKESIEASVGEVVLMYLLYGKRTIAGCAVYLFPFVLAAPLCVVALNSLLQRKADIPACALYAAALVTSLSWIILGKQHSYVHPHLNYVVWFYPMIPVCVYLGISRGWALLWNITERIEQKYGRIGWLHRICRQ